MKIYIKRLKHYFATHEKFRHIAWFIALWCGGLGAVLLLSVLLKFLMRLVYL